MMAWMMTVEMNVRSPKFEFVLPPNEEAFRDDDDGRSFFNGYRFSGSVFPNLIARQKDSKKLCDAFHIIGYICVSLKVRDIVESLEPNTHQFFPITLEAKDSTPYPVQYFIFNPCAVIDAYLDVGNAEGWREQIDGRPYRTGFEDAPLSSQEIAGRHIWVGGFLGRGDLFVSDALHDRFVRAKIRYLWFRPRAERNAIWKPEEQMPRVLAWLESDSSRIREMIGLRPDWVRKHRPAWLQ